MARHVAFCERIGASGETLAALRKGYNIPLKLLVAGNKEKLRLVFKLIDGH